MQYIMVNERCNGCGLCFQLNMYIRENDDGNAEPIYGVAIKNVDKERVKKVVSSCPTKALLIENKQITTKKGHEGIREIIDDLNLWIEKQSVTMLDRGVFGPPDKEEVESLARSLSNECMYRGTRRQTSESKARSNAKECFERYCYSENAWRNVVRKVLVDYTVKHMKPYYTREDSNESAYYIYNISARKKLGEAYEEIKNILPDNELTKEWQEFSCYPDKYIVQSVEDFNFWKGDVSVMSEVKGWLSDKSYYLSDLEVDGYSDGGFFSRKGTYWAFYGSGVDEFCTDLADAIMSLFKYDLEPEEKVNSLLKIYETQFKNELRKKAKELERLL